MKMKASFDDHELRAILTAEFSKRLGKPLKGIDLIALDSDGTEVEDLDTIEIEAELIEQGDAT